MHDGFFLNIYIYIWCVLYVSIFFVKLYDLTKLLNEFLADFVWTEFSVYGRYWVFHPALSGPR